MDGEDRRGGKHRSFLSRQDQDDRADDCHPAPALSERHCRAECHANWVLPDSRRGRADALVDGLLSENGLAGNFPAHEIIQPKVDTGELLAIIRRLAAVAQLVERNLAKVEVESS